MVEKKRESDFLGAWKVFGGKWVTSNDNGSWFYDKRWVWYIKKEDSDDDFQVTN